MVDDSDYSSSEESDSSEDLANDRIWTCDDIYPSKGVKPSVSDDSDSSDDESDDSSDDESFAAPPETKINFKANVLDSDDSDDDSSDDDAPPVKKTNVLGDRREQFVREHSSREIEETLNAQAVALKKVEEEEDTRRTRLAAAKSDFEERNARALDVSRHIDDELKSLSKEYESSDDDAIRAIEKKLEARRNNGESNIHCSEEKVKFERRNMEREMRLAKARERIEKKKDDEAARQVKDNVASKEGCGKLDMSKAARTERVYSWYSRMAMPTREKMKERVEFMPASSGVTPDDVDLLPWNARGTFVSVAAMMRINRTASSSGTAKKSTSSDDSDSD